MRLLRLAIDGSGMFHGRQIPDQGEFDSGLVVLSGPNESGKTTLLAFLRGLMYGFPDARKKENRYPPLAGGRHGSRVLLSDGTDRRIWVERFSGSKGGPVRVYEDAGAELPAAALSGLLAHIPEEVCRGVFAFGLAELAGLDTLDAEGITDRIYGAGLGTAVSPAKVAEELEKSQARILRPWGKARLNEAALALAEKRGQLRTVGDLQGEYERRCSELEDAEQESSRLSSAVETALQSVKTTLPEALYVWLLWAPCRRRHMASRRASTAMS
ncbi:MAG: AAA family ATPase [Armatimonadetes bacterium]|nr:AAA family ATPase [Gemmatimonadales bacterium]NIO75906.1 AAA family ATPase [Armatimonadota bacterium]